MSVGKNIKARRKELHMNAETLAERLGVSPSTIYRYESGAIEKVDSAKLIPIAEALSTTPAELMGWPDRGEKTAPAADPIAPIIPRVRTVVDAWSAAATPAEKLALFSSVLDHVVYEKTRRCYRNNAPTDYLILTLFPKLPESPDF